MPWLLGPPDGRYLVRAAGAGPATSPTHVLVIAGLRAPRRPWSPRRTRTRAAPQPSPTPVATGQATVIEVGVPLRTDDDARAWLARAGEDQLADALRVLARVLAAYRVIVADPYLPAVGREHLLAARVGYGVGEQVADGAWTEAVQLTNQAARPRRLKAILPQARLAAVLGERERLLSCEELALRARLDLDQDRPEQAALQLSIALDAAIAQLGGDRAAPALDDRLAELRDHHEAVAAAAQAALRGHLGAQDRAAVSLALARLEAALRARAAAYASES